MIHSVFITGASGYVGGMLADQFSKRADVKQVVCLDKREQPDLLKGNEKIVWFTANTAGNDWQGIVRWLEPTIVIHCAWQIREIYGKRRTQWLWNVEGSQNVFDLAFETPSVKKLIHFSTASSYGAFAGNTLGHHFTEDEHFRENEYLYGIEKKVAEERLRERYVRSKMNDERAGNPLRVCVVRPAAITGPRGRYQVVRFGLQSMLQRRVLAVIPVTTKVWCRQFVHEDDVTDIVARLAFSAGGEREYDVFNLSPASVVLAKDMAEVMGKRTLRITPLIARIAFFFLFHLSRGRIPTAKGGWKFYSYPIVLDGSKVTRELDYCYKWDSRAALEKLEGRYAEEAKKYM